MLCLNPYVPAVIDTCREAMKETGSAVMSGNTGDFERIFNADAAFFGDFAGQAASLTDFLIGCMVKR
jgi:hypothetical protein